MDPKEAGLLFNQAKVGFREALLLFGKAFKVSFKTQGTFSLCVSLLGLAAAFLPMLISVTLGRFSDEVAALFGAGSQSIRPAFYALLTLAGLYVLQAVSRFLSEYRSYVNAASIMRYTKETVIRCTCKVKYKYIENYDSFKTRITFVDHFGGFLVAHSMQSVPGIVQNLITLISIAVVFFSINVWIIVALLATSLPAVVLSYKQKDDEYVFRTKFMTEGKYVIDLFLDSCAPYSLNEVRYFSIFEYIKLKWKNISKVYVAKKAKITKKYVLFNSISDVLRNSVYIIILLIISDQIFKNPLLGVGTFMLVFSLASHMQTAATNLFAGAAQFVGNLSYYREFFALEDLEYEQLDGNDQLVETGDINFDHVDFTYPEAKTKTLTDINVTIRHGEKIAIVGENGSGKTTFINLLCAMYEPDAGKITIGGLDPQSNLAKIRNSISAVFQNFGRYQDTIRRNITLSDNKRNMDDEELTALCRELDAEGILLEKENGLDEMVGSFSDESSNLSGGQWQKIAILRAAYRKKAKIMVLDEPTASLDPIAEANLYRNFSDLAGERTTILVSHRLGICKIVDRVLVFSDGRVVEQGSHDELMLLRGLYFEMYEAQAQWYH